MKTILLVSTEKTPEDPGHIEHGAQYGLKSGLLNVPNLRAVLESVSGLPVQTIHHTQIATTEIAANYVFLSGRFSPWDCDKLDQEYADLLSFIRSTSIPTFGICAGMQLIAHACGALVAPMADAKGEFGFTPMKTLWPHPVTAGLKEFSCLEMHHDEVKAAPERFDLLASSQNCRVQMIAHRTRPLIGTQFHPELQSIFQRDGRKVLENFFKIY